MIVMLHPAVLLIISRMPEDSYLQLQLVHHKVCAGSNCWWTVEGGEVIWEERSLVPQGSSMVVGLMGPGSFLMD